MSSFGTVRVGILLVDQTPYRTVAKQQAANQLSPPCALRLLLCQYFCVRGKTLMTLANVGRNRVSHAKIIFCDERFVVS